MSLPAPKVFGAAQQIVLAHTATVRPPTTKWGVTKAGDYRYWLEPGRDEGERVLICKRPLLANPTAHGDIKGAPWIAGITVRSNGNEGTFRVVFHLAHGRTENGALLERKMFVGFKDRFFGLLAQKDPTFRSI